MNKINNCSLVQRLLMVDILSKGGNFLLNIGPSPEGE
ncbi:MAG TPA: alpha-L-fucosidase [Prolixibacteraceae bacterium]|nr:alpha-L-fucosidase [Prolixibacteraceae bacterium]